VRPGAQVQAQRVAMGEHGSTAQGAALLAGNTAATKDSRTH
jgi:hypothetical protein